MNAIAVLEKPSSWARTGISVPCRPFASSMITAVANNGAIFARSAEVTRACMRAGLANGGKRNQGARLRRFVTMCCPAGRRWLPSAPASEKSPWLGIAHGQPTQSETGENEGPSNEDGGKARGREDEGQGQNAGAP